MGSYPLCDVSFAHVDGMGVRSTMPNHVYAAQIGKVGVIKVESQERAPFIALALDPVNVHVYPYFGVGGQGVRRKVV